MIERIFLRNVQSYNSCRFIGLLKMANRYRRLQVEFQSR